VRIFKHRYKINCYLFYSTYFHSQSHETKLLYCVGVISGITRRGNGEQHLPPGTSFWGAKLRSEDYVIIIKSQMSVDDNIYDLQNGKCQPLLPSCKISSRSPRFAKWAVNEP